MRCISLHQPYASLCVLPSLTDPITPVKPYETRHWPTKVRGRVLIHAAKKWTWDQISFCKTEPFWTQIRRLPENRDFRHAFELPLGCIVGAVEIVECFQVGQRLHHLTRLHDDKQEVLFLRADEDADALAFGDFAVGRYAWALRNPVMFKTPIAYKGMQGFFNVPAAVVAGQMEAEGAV